MDKEQLEKELSFQTARSSGSGGQHVNKVATKVTLAFDIQDSEGLSETEKERLFEKLAAQINKDGILKISCESTRSQLNNKILVVEKFYSLLEEALIIRKKRKPTKISKAQKEERLKQKKRISDKKAMRKKVIEK